MAQCRSVPPVRMSGQTNRSRTSAPRPRRAVDRQRPRRRGRSADRGGRRGSGRPPPRRRRASRRAPTRADSWRTGSASTTPSRQPRWPGERRPVEVEAPAVAELGEREQLGGRPPAERGHRPDLDEARLAHERRRPPPRDLPGRMAAERLRRLRQVKAKRLTNRNKPIKERARKAHVVVDDEQSSRPRTVAGPRGRRTAASTRFRFSNLPPLRSGRRPCARRSVGVRGAGRAEGEAHVVALGVKGVQRVGH